ncbi:MAG TPA: fibronectin type III domain-containing protein, partial [Terriglobia bacterium]|nr:fibronectin type III domain-containing protein [Terriglobia bacterium]
MIYKNEPRSLINRLFGSVILWSFVFGCAQMARADSTWVYAVQISATVQVSPPRITLKWQPDQYGANSYTIYRKAKTATSWGSPIATLSGATTNYADTAVVVGATYEYQIVKAATLGYTGYGYIYSGVNAALTD